MSARDKWDAIYARTDDSVPQPVNTLRDFAYLLPDSGAALDLACGRGGNALYLAELGLQTSAWDISPVAIEQLRQCAAKQNLIVNAQSRDVLEHSLGLNSFDVIVVSRFLERKITAQIVDALNPGGLLFYQTFMTEKVSPVGPSNPEYLLTTNELLSLFSGLIVRVLIELGTCGDQSIGLRNEALFIGQKPSS